jgi:two-component system chemotaxis sensor kinase CheA
MAICPDIPAEHRQAFLSEAEDNMKVWEQTLLSLEKEPTDKELLNKLFRAVHTLKGCAGFVSCDLMLELTHELESVLQGARDQGMALGPDVIADVRGAGPGQGNDHRPGGRHRFPG